MNNNNNSFQFEPYSYSQVSQQSSHLDTQASQATTVYGAKQYSAVRGQTSSRGGRGGFRGNRSAAKDAKKEGTYSDRLHRTNFILHNKTNNGAITQAKWLPIYNQLNEELESTWGVEGRIPKQVSSLRRRLSRAFKPHEYFQTYGSPQEWSMTDYNKKTVFILTVLTRLYNHKNGDVVDVVWNKDKHRQRISITIPMGFQSVDYLSNRWYRDLQQAETRLITSGM